MARASAVGLRVLGREHPCGRAHQRTGDGGVHSPAHDVAEDGDDPAVVETADVVVVPADVGASRLAVDGADLPAGQLGKVLRQQGGLEHRRHTSGLRVEVGVVDGEAGPSREVLGEGDILGARSGDRTRRRRR